MLAINRQLFSLDKVLFVFALPEEAGQIFSHLNPIFTGVGKINATIRLIKAIHKERPGLIVNLGSAGSNFFRTGEVVSCNKFIQRDMDAVGLGFPLFKTPFSEVPVVLEHGILMDNLPEGICGSGDSFEMDHQQDLYQVVDMEAYAFASVAKVEQIPFLCLKYISDGADGAAGEDWSIQVHQAAESFKALLFPQAE